MDNVRFFLEFIATLRVDQLLVPVGVVIFLVGVVLLYKKGFWPWLPMSLFGIILVAVAAFAKFFS